MDKVNYEQLSKLGLQHLQSLGAGTWTDHNSHDPGITILEQLSYALTDLAYRANFPVEDLLTEVAESLNGNHYRADQMLSTRPVTLLDWRRLLLDIPGVQNAWIGAVDTLSAGTYKPQVYYDDVDQTLSLAGHANDLQAPLDLKGLYQIALIPEGDFDKRELIARTKACFHSNRNLCEDLYQVEILKEQAVSVTGQVEVEHVSGLPGLAETIYKTIYQYISPSLHFYSLKEMEDKGYSLAQIMDGPCLQHGYLAESELRELKIRRELHISDLVHLLMNLPGVRAVHHFKIVAGKQEANMDPGHTWSIHLPKGTYGRLQFPSEAAEGLDFLEEGQVLRMHIVHANLHKAVMAHFPTKSLDKKALQPSLPNGRKRSVEEYQSIINQFPELYGIGPMGVPANSSEARRAQAKQLQAYLSIFDQLLANTFSQLGAMPQLLDVGQVNTIQTYFRQSIAGTFKGFEELVYLEEYGKLIEEKAGAKERQKRMLHYLLARYGEQFGDFDWSAFEGTAEGPANFLKDYAAMSYHRFGAMDYTQFRSARVSISYLEKRLAYLLGLPLARPVTLSQLPDSHPGAFYLVEHILLRPVLDDRHQQSPIVLLPFNGTEDKPPQRDPYSLQLSYVFPSWLTAFDDTKPHWQFVLKTLRMQTPAHLKIYVHLLNPEEMQIFEKAYLDWLTFLPNKTTDSYG